MATATSTCPVSQIGETAGLIWHTLAENGPLTVAKLAKTTGVSRDNVMQGIGWLAREGKIAIEENGRSRTVCLR